MTVNKILLFSILACAVSVTGMAKTINVLSNQSISRAVTSADAGDTLLLGSGTFTQSAITINKSLIIQGAGLNNTIIRSPSVLCFKITASDVTIKDLRIVGAKPGISVNLSNQTVNNLKINSVRIENGSGSNPLADAIKVEAGTTVTNMEIDSSILHNNSGAGLHFPVGSFGNGLTISNTTFSKNDAGIFQRHRGRSGFITNLKVTNNCNFDDNDFEGISAQELGNAVIENSKFKDNKRGVYINKFFNRKGGVNNITIRGNTFTDSTAQSIWLRILSTAVPLGPRGITIESNSFIQNVDSRTLGKNPVYLETQGTFEAVIDAIFQNANDDQHGPLNINKNTFNLTGSFTTATTSETAFAIALNSGIKNVTINGNVMNGGNINALSSAAVKTSGIFFITNDGFGTIPDSAVVNVTGNKITGFESGASIYDLDRASFGFLDDDATITFSNNFLVNDKGILSGNDGAAINASGNWWGSRNERSISKRMTGKVDFTPYLTSGEDTDGDPDNGFQGNFTLLQATSSGEQTGTLARAVERRQLLNNTPTFTSLPPTAEIDAGSVYTYNITTSDADRDRLSLSAPTLPGWLRFNNNNNGTGTITGTAVLGVANNVVLVVKDSPGGFIKKQIFTINVVAPGNRTQSISFVPGWNHISLNVKPQDKLIRSIFSSVITNIEIVTGEGKEFDPLKNDSLNTLQSFADSKGYWVKVKSSSSAFTLDVSGGVYDFATTTIPLNTGWNNVGFIMQNPTSVRTALADLITANELIKVVGGTQSFDPDFPDTLNTLLQFNPGKGYWVKIKNAVADFNFQK